MITLESTSFWKTSIWTYVWWFVYAGSWTLRADPPEFLPDAALVSAGPPRPVGRHGNVRGDLAPPGARREPPEIRGPKMQFCPSPQGGARSVHLRFITVAFTQMGGGHFFVVRGDLAPPGARREPPEIRGPKMQFCPSPQGGARRVHLRFITVAFTQMGGGHFFSPTNPLFVHLTIKVTERPRNPLGPPPHTPDPPPPPCPRTHCLSIWPL